MSSSVYVLDDPVRALAERLATVLRESAPAYIAVSGGSTPKPLYRLLATEYRDSVPWDRVTIFQVDERCVPPTHRDSNWRMLQETLLADLPDVIAHAIDTQAPDPAGLYEAQLRSLVPREEDGVPVLDAVLLGMGADGHTASLFPGTSALEERGRLVVENEVPQLKTRRITMTYPVLEAAQHRWFLATGDDKADAFKRVRKGELPAGRLKDAEWFVDPAVVGK